MKIDGIEITVKESWSGSWECYCGKKRIAHARRMEGGRLHVTVRPAIFETPLSCELVSVMTPSIDPAPAFWFAISKRGNR